MSFVSVCGSKNDRHPTAFGRPSLKFVPAPVCGPRSTPSASVHRGFPGHAVSDVTGGNAARTCLAMGLAFVVTFASPAVVGTKLFADVAPARILNRS